MLAHPGPTRLPDRRRRRYIADQIVGGSSRQHVFSEKPLALNLPTACAWRRWPAKHPKQVAMIGYVRPIRSQLSRRLRQDQGRVDRPPFLARSQTTDKHDPSGFFVRYAGASGGILLDMSVHDIDTGAVAAWEPVVPSACTQPGRSRSTRGCATCPTSTTPWRRSSSRTADRDDLRVADDAARPRDADGDRRHHGRLIVGQNPRINRVEISDAHGVRNECTPTFYERFADAFQNERRRSSMSSARASRHR
jgi:myo-inositol 2-dehydrogenase/D-chiro-inositol 1-dehydrogenase